MGETAGVTAKGGAVRGDIPPQLGEATGVAKEIQEVPTIKPPTITPPGFNNLSAVRG